MTDPSTRILRILGLLGSRATWSGAELSELLGVTPRTVRRDVDRLRQLGYTIDSDVGVGGGYALGRGQVLPPLLLADDEALTVALALSASAAAGSGLDSEASLRAWAKLDAVMPSALRKKVNGLLGTLQQEPQRARLDSSLLLVCAGASESRVMLSFGYTDRHGELTQRKVEPHRLLARNGAWKLIAFDPDRADWRAFRLDHMTDAKPSTWRFAQRPGLEEAVERSTRPAPIEAWRVQVLAHLAVPLEEASAMLPGDAGELRALDDATTEFRFGAHDAASAAQWIARIGVPFTVLGEQSVMEEVALLADRLRAAVKIPIQGGVSGSIPRGPS